MEEKDKEPLFEKGQFVRVKKREGKDSDYKYRFTDDMTAFSGDICVIDRVFPNCDHNKRKQEDDNAKYYIRGKEKNEDEPFNYSWASSMLEAVEAPEPTYHTGQKVRIKKRTKDRYGTVYYTDDMNKHRGEIHTIISFSPHPGAYHDDDDFHVYKLQKVEFSWTKSMLEPLEEERKAKDEVAMLEESSAHFDKVYESYIETSWPKDAKFHFNQKVQIASVITSDTPGFIKEMIDYAGNEAHIEIAAHLFKHGEYFYKLDKENGGDIWWPESLLTEIN